MNEIGRKIADKLIEIHGSTDFTIAFFPYKRSMWNSMESVYEECIKSGVDAHCMPIPYYRMRENKKIDYIDTDYDLFGDIAEPYQNLDDMNPRFIAIHYQYDGNNLVTNMLPEFYTNAIKMRYNCDIIMLPYGIAADYRTRRDGNLAPGCINVDYMFCASEDDRQGCINTWANYGIDYSKRAFGFGSPKIDAVLKATRDIPDEWKDAIGDRKVILLVNSLGPYLERPFEKITLYARIIQDEVDKGNAVIFRPHPLLRTTIKSMRPDTEVTYQKLIRKIKNTDHVILDESEYPERAMGIADYMISDMPSSMVVMWRATNKPYEEI